MDESDYQHGAIIGIIKGPMIFGQQSFDLYPKHSSGHPKRNNAKSKCYRY